MYPPVIAEQLRRRGHDVVAITEQPELRSAEDAAVFVIAQQRR
jgi:NADPH-dependent 2,4-dienoyl-CoA reductase/sulfur reductase-like enzyme